MSTPSIAAPGRPSQATRSGGRPAVTRLVRSREGDPVWSRPMLWGVALLAGVLAFWGLTRNGYGNTYYAEAAQAASHSWKAWLTNALDVSGSDSLDKGPLSDMLMGLSGRALGFSSFSMLLPEALCGVGSVVVLHNVVKRTMGHRAAIVAALILALTPIFVAMSRFNNPDAVLVLTAVAAAWGLVRALESGRTGYLVISAVFVGLAFNVKMLEAYLIVPGLAIAFFVAGRGSVRRRLAQLGLAGGAMAAVSFAWYGAMMLLPAADRPWVGDTTDNSWFSLIFGANGLSRVAGNSGGGGPGGGGGFGGSTGPLRMFNSIVGGQIGWLLPLAAAGLALGLWTGRRAARTDLGRASYLLWGGWALVCWAVFSFSQGIFHPYYTTMLAPAVAALAGGGLTVAWERARESAVWAAGLAAAVIASAVLGASLLGYAAGFVPWLAPAAIAAAVVGGGALVVARTGWAAGSRGRRLSAVAVVGGAAALLAGPAAYSIATVGRTITGSNPLAGPASVASSGFGGGGPGGGGRRGGPFGQRPFGQRPAGAALFGPPPSGAFPAGGGGPGGDAAVSRTLVSYLEAHQGSARYLVAAVGSGTAAGIALQTGRDVIDMGGFMGSDPAPSLAGLEHLVGSGQLHYVLLGGAGGRGPGGLQTSTSTSRDAWIRQHGKVVTVAGQTGSGTLYYLA